LPAVLVAILAVEVIDARRQSGIPFEPPPRGPQEYGSGPLLEYVVLGDSTAVGQGAPYERGIAVSTARHLSARGRRVRLVNLAVSGAPSRMVTPFTLATLANERRVVVCVYPQPLGSRASASSIARSSTGSQVA
jgi:hypothetical protein